MPRGRPKGSKNVSTLIREGKLNPETLEPIRPPDPRSDDEILATTKERFVVFDRMMTGVIQGDITALIVSGASGTGKSYTAHQALENAKDDNNAFQYIMVSGTVTPIELYKLAWRYRHPRNVIVLDDADGVMANEDGLNVLKGLLDTGTVRRVSWLSNSSALKEDGEEVDHEYCEGCLLLIRARIERLSQKRSKGEKPTGIPYKRYHLWSLYPSSDRRSPHADG
jgi:hypothetical protein